LFRFQGTPIKSTQKFSAASQPPTFPDSRARPVPTFYLLYDLPVGLANWQIVMSSPVGHPGRSCIPSRKSEMSGRMTPIFSCFLRFGRLFPGRLFPLFTRAGGIFWRVFLYYLEKISPILRYSDYEVMVHFPPTQAASLLTVRLELDWIYFPPVKDLPNSA